MTKYAIVDIETTGGDPKVDKITEIAILVYDGAERISRFSTLINPEKNIPPFISDLTGITNEMVREAPRLEEVAEKIIAMTNENVFVAHNVKFDYSLLRDQLKSLGFPFSRQQLCTVKLSRTLIPGAPSYSLGNLCRFLNIALENRHRAMGDAEATTKLFEYLVSLDQNQEIQKQTKEDPERLFLTPQITLADIEVLPEETGVYRFLDENENLIYAGHSQNIQKRALNHFISKSKPDQKLCQEIHSVTYDITGSDLVAELWQMKEIIEKIPRHNEFDGRKVYTYGLYVHPNETDFLHMEVDRVKNREAPPILTYADNKEAQTQLRETLAEFNLCLNFSNLGELCPGTEQRTCLGACRGLEPASYYNGRVEEAVHRLKYPDDSFLIICKGPNPEYQSFVLILLGQYQGFGFVDTVCSDNLSLGDLKKRMHPSPESHEIVRIIQKYLKRHPRARCVPLPSSADGIEKD